MKPKQAADEQVLSEINITPFTDVLLVLLIIFMILAALTVPPGFERSLGNAPATGHVRIANSVPVVLDRNGRITIAGRSVTVPMLYNEMLRLAHANAQTRIALYADARVQYALVVRVLDAAKIAGLHDVSFVTE